MMQSEIRLDYIHDRAVIITPSRRSRPHSFHPDASSAPAKAADCVFCPQKLTTPSIEHFGGKRRWSVNVIPNIFPIVSTRPGWAYGRQEVIVETPKHNVELAELPIRHIADVLSMYGRRTRTLMRDRRLGYILIFKNNGGRAGASIDHAHSQIFASEFVPPHVRTKLIRAQEYRISHSQCYYCHLMDEERNGSRWIADVGSFVAFTPYASSYNYEVWIIPKREVDNISELTPAEQTTMARLLKRLLGRLRKLGLPYNYYLHQNVRDRQEHLYLRLCPRRDVWAGIELGSRLIVNSVSPEEAAKFYRAR